MAVGIIFIVVGIVFVVTGYQIKIKKHYDKVWNLNDKKQAEMDKEAYAQRIGKRDLLAGAAFIVAGLFMILGHVFHLS